MTLPIKPGYAPMEARIVSELPTGPRWQYEPKWDGFRCLAFRDGASVELRSKSGQPLTRYFPEVAAALRAVPATRFVLDGEIVVPTDDGGRLSFDALLQRIHPAASRIERLARETPAAFVVFDLLVDGRGANLTSHPLADRRARLKRFATANRIDRVGIVLSPATRRLQTARKWLAGQAGTDGVMAKRTDLPYASGDGEDQAQADRRLRGGWLPLRHQRQGRRVVATRTVR
jgi:ATP-dependent DNA ligase